MTDLYPTIPTDAVAVSMRTLIVCVALVVVVLAAGAGAFAWREHTNANQLERLRAEIATAQRAADLRVESLTRELAASRVQQVDTTAIAKRSAVAKSVEREVTRATTTEDLAGYINRATSGVRDGDAVDGAVGRRVGEPATTTNAEANPP